MTPRSPRPHSPNSKMTLKDDGVLLLEHHIVGSDDFAAAAEDVFALLKLAQARHPAALRSLIVTIEGHDGERAGYDADFFEFQQEFMLGALGRYFTWIQMPLTGALANPRPQQDDMADTLRVDGASSPTGTTGGIGPPEPSGEV